MPLCCLWCGGKVIAGRSLASQNLLGPVERDFLRILWKHSFFWGFCMGRLPSGSTAFFLIWRLRFRCGVCGQL